jgi:hypothetical protein
MGHHHPGDILRLDHLFGRDRGTRRHGGGDISGTDGESLDAEGCTFREKGLRQRPQAELGSGLTSSPPSRFARRESGKEGDSFLPTPLLKTGMDRRA